MKQYNSNENMMVEQLSPMRYSDCSDAQLVNAACEGDEKAGEYLCLVRYLDTIKRAAGRYAEGDNKEHLVLTVVTDVWEECHRSGWKCLSEHSEHVGGYLAGMAKHRAYKLLMDAKLVSDTVGCELPSNEHGELDAALRAWYEDVMLEDMHARKLQQLSDALDTLPEADQFVLKCKFEDGMGMMRIAEVLPKEYYPAHLRGFARTISSYEVKKMLDCDLKILRDALTDAA